MLKNSIILLFVAALVVADQGQMDAPQQCPSVFLKNGKVIGALRATQNIRKKVCAYTSIPYARPPVGDLRFQPPQPAKPWGTLNATLFPNWCPQSTTIEAPNVTISEDCLYLNLYKPRQLNSKGPGLPVMIWFHGGSFNAGGSLYYSPVKLLSRGDVILVVVHYRLGLLGFLSLGNAMIPGNNGLKDQAFAIKWVNQNVKAFGGNPNKVIIFGESAGAASVNFQLLSPLNKGLIHGAVCQSGTAISSWALDRNPRESAGRMARRLGCPTAPLLGMVACLKKAPWEKIVEAQNEHTANSYATLHYPYATMTPVIEPKNMSGAFITEEPLTLMKSGKIPDIPIMLGGNKHEGSLILAFLYLSAFRPRKLDKNAKYLQHQLIPDILKCVNEPEKDLGNRAVASTLELAFFPGVKRTNWNETMPGLVDVLSVLAFKASIQNAAEILSGLKRKVYLYSFEHHSKNTLWPFLNLIPVEHGIMHGDELIYLFNFPSKFTREDQAVSNIMCDMWLNFARFGNPTPDKKYTKWEPYNILKEPYMKLNSRPRLMYGYRKSWRPNEFKRE